jgi:hypothetical protein
MEVQVECIKKWEEYICVLEKEMPTLEMVVDSLKKMKDAADKDFTKVEDCIMLVTTGEEESLVLQITFDTQNTKVQGLHFENNLVEYVIGSALVELKSLQQKVDFQTNLVQAFKLLL